MRLVTLAFPSTAAFLAAYEEDVLTVKTRTDATLGEQLLVEVSFPGLPNRALVRGTVDGLLIDEEGLRVRLSDEDASTRDFMLGIARGQLKVGTHRDHKRFPAALPVRYRADGGAEVAAVIDDLGAGGTFVLTAAPPTAGARVEVTIAAPDGRDLKAQGVVAWVKTGPGAGAGFGVDFDPVEGEDGRRLRALLRRASESAEVDLGSKDG